MLKNKKSFVEICRISCFLWVFSSADMATVRYCASVFPSNQRRSPTPVQTKRLNLSLRLPRIRSSSSDAVETKTDPVSPGTVVTNGSNVLACPICYDQLIRQVVPGVTVISRSSSSLQCRICRKSYADDGVFLDMTIATGSKEYVEVRPNSSEFFRNPLISFLYERGWRQNFIWGGFPGPEKEFEMAKKHLRPTIGGTIVDASCGSGLISRIFAKSGIFSLVVALDISEAMLWQCYEFMQQEGMPKENLVLVRADISRLPFVSSSVDAVHAGAALHCWPSPSSGVAEISRILKPGGVFVATTFILDGIFSFLPYSRTFRQNLAKFSGTHFYLSERELEDLCRVCGLVDFTCERNGLFVMISATKPS